MSKMNGHTTQLELILKEQKITLQLCVALRTLKMLDVDVVEKSNVLPLRSHMTAHRW